MGSTMIHLDYFSFHKDFSLLASTVLIFKMEDPRPLIFE